MMGPLVGQAFVTAVATYAEMSGAGSGPAALAQGLSPLDGLVVPTLGAYDLAVTFLFPFVAIRLVSSERESGASKILAQTPARITSRMAVKAAVLLGGWILAWLPAFAALWLWQGYGGHLAWPETANVFLGHLLHAFLAAGVAVAAASVCHGSASAAIVTLGFTVGTWALNFVAAGRGGLLESLAQFTPASALRAFEHGELRLATLTVMILLGIAGFTFAGLWLDPYRSLVSRLLRSAMIVGLLWGATFLASSWRFGWDLAEDRRNSFPKPDEAVLRTLEKPVHVTVYLSPEDPRLTDLEQNVLRKLRRVLPRFDVTYAAGSRTGLFENPDSHYGEIWYQVGSRKDVLRSTIEPVVLAKLYELAGVAPPAETDEPGYSGYPLAALPATFQGAALFFYLACPLLVVLAYAASRRRWRSSCRNLV